MSDKKYLKIAYEDLIREGFCWGDCGDLMDECIDEVFPLIKHICDPAMISQIHMNLGSGKSNVNLNVLLKLIDELHAAIIGSKKGADIAAEEYERQQIANANSCHMDVDQINDELVLNAA